MPAEQPAAWQPSDTELFTTHGDAFVPHRREQIAVVCDLLAGIPEPRVLDLCCGEGLLSAEYLRRDTRARVTLLDGSPEMLDKAAARLAPFAGRWERVRADIHDRDWRRGAFGGVMTSLAVHHLDGAGTRELYRDLHGMLVPGGVFVMADLVEPAGARARAVAAEHWDRAVRDAGGDEAARAFERAEWNYYRLPGPDPLDTPSSVAEHLTWLADAGFADADVVWLHAGHAIFTATRP
ncbi:MULTISPECIES: class I SAM-dependent methyltransferase [Amycolatopsis]|uniref:class I SAM-dependent methyltransferase n=1 Tax=Amycolatopsis TaxID=1813 RepID=UPI000B8AE87B|nr:MULTISPECIES: class I SAM-dependent methyltransferase [Amycolatopsis]OXM74854.1 SAM-dependent methyltransferase [Amycolatopsis sp. KNN50.9b]